LILVISAGAALSVTRGVSLDGWADEVLGQPGFKEVYMNETSTDRIWDAASVEVDSIRRMIWTSDTNGRVLGIPFNGYTVTETTTYNATTVIGQITSGETTCNGDSSFSSGQLPAPTAASLCGQRPDQHSLSEAATGGNVAIDLARGTLYVPDYWNNRVLGYTNPTSDQVADVVLGQANYTSGINLSDFGCNRGNEDSPTATTLCFQRSTYDDSGFSGGLPGVFVDTTGDNVWVADTMNHRVLRFPIQNGLPSTTPNAIIGQTYYTSTVSSGCAEDWGNQDESLLCRPAAILVDSDETVYVANQGHIPPGGQPPFYWYGWVSVFKKSGSTWVIDQIWDGDGRWYSGSTDYSGILSTTTGFMAPTGLEFDANGDIYVTDTGNHEVILLNDSNGAFLKVIGKAKPVWVEYSQGHLSCGDESHGGPYGFYSGHPYWTWGWDSSVNRSSFAMCEPPGNVGSLPSGDIIVTSRQGQQSFFSWKTDYSGDTCSYSACFPYSVTRVFNRWQEGQRNKVTDSSLGYQQQSVVVMSNYDGGWAILSVESGIVRVWKYPWSDKVADEVWAQFPLVDWKGKGASYVPGNGLGYHGRAMAAQSNSGTTDLWMTELSASNWSKFVHYTTPLTANESPDTTISSPLPVKGTSSTMGWPKNIVAIYPYGNDLWVVDRDNQRVFRIADARTNPIIDVVLGTPYYDNDPTNNCLPYAWTFCDPNNVSVDNYGNLYVSEGSDEGGGNERLIELDERHFPHTSQYVIQSISYDRVYPVTDAQSIGFNKANQMFIGPNVNRTPGTGKVRAYDNPIRDWQSAPNKTLSDFNSFVGSLSPSESGVLTADANRSRILSYWSPIGGYQGTVSGPAQCSGTEYLMFDVHNPTSSTKVIWERKMVRNKTNLTWYSSPVKITLSAYQTKHLGSVSSWDVTDVRLWGDQVAPNTIQISNISNYCS